MHASQIIEYISKCTAVSANTIPTRGYIESFAKRRIIMIKKNLHRNFRPNYDNIWLPAYTTIVFVGTLNYIIQNIVRSGKHCCEN